MKHHDIDITHAQFFILAKLIVGGGIVVAETEDRQFGDCVATFVRPLIFGNSRAFSRRDGIFLRKYGEKLMPQTFGALVDRKWLERSWALGENKYIVSDRGVEVVRKVLADYPKEGTPDWYGWYEYKTIREDLTRVLQPN